MARAAACAASRVLVGAVGMTSMKSMTSMATVTCANRAGWHAMQMQRATLHTRTQEQWRRQTVMGGGAIVFRGSAPTRTFASGAAGSGGGGGGSSASQHLRQERQRQAAIRSSLYFIAVAVSALGATYASVPLYRMFCQATGFGGTTARVDDIELKLEDARRRSGERAASSSLRPITVEFTSEVSEQLPWKFTPSQRKVRPHTWPRRRRRRRRLRCDAMRCDASVALGRTCTQVLAEGFSVCAQCQ